MEREREIIQHRVELQAKEREMVEILKEECGEVFDRAGVAARDMEQKYGVSDSHYEPKIYESIEDSGILFKVLFISHYKTFTTMKSRLSDRVAKAVGEVPDVEFAYPTMRYIPTAEPSGFEVRIQSAT